MTSRWITVNGGRALQLQPSRDPADDDDAGQVRYLCEQLRLLPTAAPVLIPNEAGEKEDKRVLARGVLHDLETVVILADIVKLSVDVLVNAANAGFWHGGGVAWYIKNAAKPEFETAGRAWLELFNKENSVKFGEGMAAFVRTRMKDAKSPVVGVVNAVGPGEGRDTALVGTATEAAFRSLPPDMVAPSLAIPLIGGGIFKHDKRRCAELISAVVAKRAASGWVGRVVLVSFDKPEAELFATAAAAVGLVAPGDPPPPPDRFRVSLLLSSDGAADVSARLGESAATHALDDGTTAFFVGREAVLRALCSGMAVD